MADYPISNVPRRVQYVNSGVGPYAFTFEVIVQTDIAVYRGNTLLTLTTDYSVTINANGTGSVTLVVGGTGNITIVGVRAIQRSSDYTTGGDLFASTLNTDLDSQTIYSQQLAETVSRTVRAPITDASTLNMELPASTVRANKVLAFDSSGNPVQSTSTLAAIESAVNTIDSIATSSPGSSASVAHIAAGTGAVATTVQAKLRDTVALSDYDSLRNALATGKRVLVPASTTSISISTTDSPFILPALDRIDAESDLTLNIASGIHTTASGNIANVGQNHNITVVGTTPATTTLSSVASVSGSAGAYTVAINVADASSVAIGDYIKLDNVVPLLTLSGDNSVFRIRVAENELLNQSALLGAITASSGGGSASWGSVASGYALSDFVSSGDLLTIKGQTREIDVVSTTSATIVGTWTNGVAGSRGWYLTRPNSGTVGTGGSSSTTVTGSSSLFTDEANVGDILLADGKMVKITVITSDTSITVSPAVTLTDGTKYSIITAGLAHEGTFEVTNVVGNQVTVTNTWRGLHAPPVNGISGGEVKVLKTILRNTGTGDGFSFEQNSSLKFANNLVLKGNGSSTGSHGIALNGRAPEGPTQMSYAGVFNGGDGLAITKWGRGAFVGHGCSLQTRRSHYTSNQAFGVWALEGSSCILRECIISGTNGRGMQINSNTTVKFTEGYSCGNTSDGVNLESGSTLYGEIPGFYQNGGMGVRAGGTVGLHINEGVCSVNGLSGIYGTENASGNFSRVLFACNNREGVELLENCRFEGSGLWATGNNGSAGSGRGIFLINSTLKADNSALVSNSGAPAYVTGITGNLIANNSFITGTAGGGVVSDAFARVNIANGEADTVTVSEGGFIYISGVSPAPTIIGTDRVNEVSTAGSLVSNGSAAATGFALINIGGDEAIGFLRRGTVVHDFPSISAGGQQSVDVTVTGATTTNHVAMANSNSLSAGLVLSATIPSANTVRIFATNPTGGSIDPGNATITWFVIGA
jgi:hypothetical protein